MAKRPKSRAAPRRKNFLGFGGRSEFVVSRKMPGKRGVVVPNAMVFRSRAAASAKAQALANSTGKRHWVWEAVKAKNPAHAKNGFFDFLKPRVYSATTKKHYSSDAAAKADRVKRQRELKEEKRRERAALVERRRDHLEDLRFEAARKKAQQELKRIERAEDTAERKIDAAKEKHSRGGMTESQFDQTKARLEREIEKQEKHRAAVLARNPGVKSKRGKKARRPAAPKHRPRAVNPSEEEAAKELFKTFHGKPADMLRLITEKIYEVGMLAELAELVQIVVETPTGLLAELDFALEPPEKVVYLAASKATKATGDKPAKGPQLYFRGGDQEVPLSKLNMDGPGWVRDRMELGRLAKFVYRTRKQMHKFRMVDYWHEPGEESGIRPVVLYDFVNKTIDLAGGHYSINAAGVID